MAGGRLRTTLRVLGAAVTGAGVVALAAAGVAGGMIAEAPGSEPVPAPAVDVGAASLSLVCPPAPVVPTGDGGDIDYDEEFGTGGAEAQVLSQLMVLGRDGPAETASAGEVGAGDPEEISASGNLRLFESTDGVPVALQAAPSADTTALATGAALARSDSGDLRGLTAGTCSQPAPSTWLVGGQTEAGASARLTLANPGQTPVNVTARMWGATGALEEPVTVTIPANDVRQVLLESVSMEPRLAVHLSVDGGAVAASIQDTVLNGLVAAGTATVTPTVAPAEEVQIGPVPIYNNGGGSLRLVNPGDEVATVSLDVLGADGSTGLPGAQDLQIDPHTVTDVALDGIDPGYVSIAVHSDQPVTGSVLLSRTGEPGEQDPDQPVIDRAWVPATPPAEHGLLPLLGLGSLVDNATVAVANPSEAEVQASVRPIGADGEAGEATEVSVPAGATVTVGDDDELQLGEASAVEITGGPVLASLALSGDAGDGSLVGVLPLTADADRDQSVSVRLGRY
ncbi:DUF5719 family protein [Ruania zhangjianzhongii]|uniref:DUF5719 family protein n=1 Tax=Ruania zhangjianzhongii TaxID=2603206 RepID=UPI0011C8E34A|nr:DUF5719 family protein [Ruania zhangjianzhongii]